MPELELNDEVLISLGISANTNFDDSIPTQKEEEEILKDIFDQYNIESIKDTMDEKVKFQKVYIFFMVGKVNSVYKH